MKHVKYQENGNGPGWFIELPATGDGPGERFQVRPVSLDTGSDRFTVQDLIPEGEDGYLLRGGRATSPRAAPSWHWINKSQVIWIRWEEAGK